jgi:hypothetical protein
MPRRIGLINRSDQKKVRRLLPIEPRKHRRGQQNIAHDPFDRALPRFGPAYDDTTPHHPSSLTCIKSRLDKQRNNAAFRNYVANAPDASAGFRIVGKAIGRRRPRDTTSRRKKGTRALPPQRLRSGAMPDTFKDLSLLIAEQVEASWKRCEAADEAIERLDHLADEGRATIRRSRAQLATFNERVCLFL